MCAQCANPETGPAAERLDRRSFLRASAATAIAFAGAGLLAGVAHADALTKVQRDKLSPDDVLALMKKGNKRFYSGKRQILDVLAQQRASAKGQYPAAVLLTCIDSRASAETILDLRIGDIFNSRKDSPVLAAMESSGAIKIAGAMYNLETGVVDFLAG
jgi:carbonic anhydrase